jgi:hypothetical protein
MKLQNYLYITLLFLLSINSHAAEPFSPTKISFTSGNYYSVYIMDLGRCDAYELASMLQFYNPNINKKYAEKIARIYVEECTDEGVNHDIAFCQMVLETGFLNYGGSVKKYQNNFCGLGATGGRASGEYFPDLQTGVRAHIQHLKAYASHKDITKESVDKRFRFVKRGIAPTIYALPGKWAADPLYGKKLEGLLQRLFTHRYIMANQNTP